MSPIPSLPRGVRRLFRLTRTRAQLLRDQHDEIREHLAMRTADLRALGMSEAQAEAEALRRFGDTEEFRAYAERRAAHQAHRMVVLDGFTGWTQDVRFALRQCRKAPAFSALAVLTLALGIGANTAIFSVVHRLLLAPLPYPNGNRIVMPMQTDTRGIASSTLWPLIEGWEARGHSVREIAAAGTDAYAIRPDGTVEMIPNATITSNFLHVLGVHPVLGRSFTPADERPGGTKSPVAMISYSLWQRAYGGRADAIGQTVELDGFQHTIVGVMPPGLTVPMSPNPTPDVWEAWTLEAQTVGFWVAPTAFALLRPGATADDATRELEAIAAGLPDTVQRGQRPRAMRAQDFLDARIERAIEVLFVSVGALLLIACANVANLLLARAWTRQREFAVRIALGAGRARLVRQVLTESVLLALAGGLLGLLFAWQGLKLIIALRPSSLDDLAQVHIEPVVLLWSVGVSVATGVLFGCAPAFFAGARAVGDVLKDETRTASGGAGARRVRSALIVAEVAMSLVLLVGAGLLTRSFMALQRMPLGFEPRGLVYEDVLIGGPRTGAHKQAVREAILDRLRALPGVTDAAIGAMPGKGFIGSGLETTPGADGSTVRVQGLSTIIATPNYTRVARMAVFEGRLPDPASLTAEWKAGRPFALSPEVAVSRGLALRLWPNGHAIGSRVRQWEANPLPNSPEAPWVTVVGVVDDARMPGVHGDLRSLQLYSLPHPLMGDVMFLVRTSGSGEGEATMIHRAIMAVDPALVVRPPLAGEQYLRDALAPSRFAMALLTAFALLALALSAVGLYGVIAYSVSQRTREIGVRVALGAQPMDVTRLVVRDGIRLAIAGIIVGVAGAIGATQALRGILYGVSPADPPTFIGIALLLAAIALVASYVPARRALRVDPTVALRAE
jgi:putative ABC transport system permease protein